MSIEEVWEEDAGRVGAEAGEGGMGEAGGGRNKRGAKRLWDEVGKEKGTELGMGNRGGEGAVPQRVRGRMESGGEWRRMGCRKGG